MKKTSFILKIIGAALVIFFGFYIAFFTSVAYPYYEYTSSYTYGGDAYTGIQNAAADTSNNVQKIGYWLYSTFGDFHIFIGLVTIAFGVYLLGCAFASFEWKKKTPAANAVQANAVQANAVQANAVQTTAYAAPVANMFPSAMPQTIVNAPQDNDTVSKISKLKELLDAGIITREEFEAKKNQLLGI